MPRKRDTDRALNTWASPEFSGAVESAAAARGLSKAALIRRALASYLTGAKK
jgi:hypothetical protein